MVILVENDSSLHYHFSFCGKLITALLELVCIAEECKVMETCQKGKKTVDFDAWCKR